MIPFLANLVFALIWAALFGSTDPSVLVSGFAVGYLLIAWLAPIEGSRRYALRLPRAIGLFAFFFYELVLSTLRVAWDVVTPSAYRRPGVVAVPLDAKTDAEIALLSSLVTLTPGSLSIDVSPDRSRLYIHSMFVDSPDAVAHRIKEGFERRILELLR